MIVFIMGVSGSGKSTLMHALAARLGWPTLEADEFHSAANIAKMSRGIALNEEDRRPWLDALAEAIGRWVAAGTSGLVACSALKRAHRDRLRRAVSRSCFVYLDADVPLIEARLAARTDHFMPATLAKSQFDTLEPPTASENAIVIPADLPVPQAVERVIAALDADQAGS